jgi:hypothetical protein
MTTWELGMEDPSGPFFAMAEIASKAIDDAVSKPGKNVLAKYHSFFLEESLHLIRREPLLGTSEGGISQ